VLISHILHHFGIKLLSTTFTEKQVNFVNKSLYDTVVAKSRKYDVDSNKKSVRKNLWNYIHGNITHLCDISNVKQMHGDIKNNTNKKFEIDLFNSTIEKVFHENYNLSLSALKESIKQNTDMPLLKIYLTRTVREWFDQYRKSDQFFIDAVKKCMNDQKKREQYFKIARRYFNYLDKKEKVNIDDLPDDECLPESFQDKVEQAIHNPKLFQEDPNKTSRISTKTARSNNSALKHHVKGNSFSPPIHMNKEKEQTDEKSVTVDEIYSLIKNLSILDQNRLFNMLKPSYENPIGLPEMSRSDNFNEFMYFSN